MPATLHSSGTELVRSIDVERAGRVAAVATASVVALGFLQDSGVRGLRLFDLDEAFGLPSLATTALLLGGAALALLLRADARGPRRETPGAWLWTAVTILLVALAGEELLEARERVGSRLGAGWALTWLPVVAVAATGLGAAAWRLRRDRRIAGALLAGTAIWVAGQGLDGAFAAGSLGEAVLAEALELAGVVTVALALLAAVRRSTSADAGDGPVEAWRVVERSVRSLDVRQVALGVGVVIAALAVLGGLTGSGRGAYIFELNAEQNIPAAVSAVITATAAAIAYLVWRSDRSGGAWAGWAVMAGALGFLAIDELGVIHEDIQEATGIHPGQLVLLPLVVVAGCAWLAVLRRLSDRRAQALWVGGALAWVLAQTIDATQPPNQFVWSVVPEEALEMVGSALFGLALLLVLQTLAGRSPAPRPGLVPGSA